MISSSAIRRAFALFVMLGAFVVLPQGASAATQWVAQPPETVGANTACDDPGFLSITDAIAAAAPGDTVHVCTGLWFIYDTIFLAKELTIEGDGDGSTIFDSEFTSGPLIHNESDSPLAVTDLTITDALAESPSAILTGGSLLVENAVIVNSGGLAQSVVYAVGETTIRRSIFSGLDGEYARPFVWAEDNVTVEDSTFLNNDVNGFAAGIVIPSTVDEKDLTVSGSTFTGLSAFCASAIFNGADGLGTDTVITNSTFTGNSVSGGECVAGHIVNDGTLALYSSTVSGNTTGDANDLVGLDGMTIANSIIDGDPELGRGTSCEFDFSTPTNLGGNVISDQTLGCDDFVGGPAPSLATKVPLASIALEALADNGGLTETMALGEGSVALGAAVAAECPEFDQRGVPRSADECDSGAYQASGGPPENTSPPTISGTLEVGQELTADPGEWTGDPSFAYQWERCEEGELVSTTLGDTGLNPRGIALDSSGNVYTADLNADTVTRITPVGTSSTLGETGDGPFAIAIDSSGNVYTANRNSNDVTKITPDGTSSTLGTTGTSPRAIVLDSSGNVYTANYDSSDVTKITPGGTSSTFGTTGTNPQSITLDSSGNVYTANRNSNDVTKITPDGTSSTLGTTGTSPRAIVLDPSGNVYTANADSSDVTRITPDGTSSTFGTTGAYPVSIALDSSGNVYTANYESDDVTRITPGGASSILGSTGSRPYSIALDSSGNVYTANFGSNDVTKIAPSLTCTDITDATDSTYTLTGEDEGKKVRVKVTGTNDAGSADAFSDPTTTVEPEPLSPPENTIAPTVTGTAQVGQTLSSDPGTWTGDPTYSYQWQRCTKVAGVDWQEINAPGGVAGVDWQDVTWGEGLYVAVGDTGTDRVMTSPDGTTWTVRDTPGDGNEWQSIAYGGGQFVAVASTGSDRVMTSPDGIEWTLRDTPGDDLFLGAIAYGGGKFVAGSLLPPYSFMSSTDGENWTVAGNAGAGPYGITYGGGKFVSVGYQINGTVGTSVSTDGVNWTSNPAPVDIWWQGVTYGNGKFVAVGSNIASDPERIMTSPDGATWTSATSAEIGGSWTSVDFGEGLFAAAAVSNVRMWSANGEDWYGQSGGYRNISGMVFGDGRFVGVGGSFSTFSYSTVSESDCEDIVGADQDTYEPTSEDVGKRVRVRVTGTNDAGEADGFSAPTDTVIPDVASLSVTATGANVTSEPAGIDCGSTCEFDFPFNEEVTLTAVPDPGNNIVPGSSSCPGSSWVETAGNYECSITMNQARDAEVTFRPPATLYVSNEPTGAGGSCETPDYNQISQAQGAAIDGDTVFICEGNYSGTESNKAITYEGEGTGKTRIGPGGTEGGEGFYLYGSGGAASTFRNLTIQDNDGRGIVAIAGGGPLVIDNVSFENNLGGGIQAGWFFERIPVEVSNSTFTGNSAVSGTAISAFGPVTVVNSTISGNSKLTPVGRATAGSAPDPSTDGGMIVTSTYAFSEDVNDITLLNATLAGNDLSGSPSLLTLCEGEGPCPEGEESPSGDIDVTNSIIAEDGTGCFTPFSGEVVSGGGNVIQNTTTGCDDLISGPPAPDDRVAASALALQPLAVNSPGETATMALASSSVARGAAVSAECPETDQRGVVRPANSCDSGAYQSAATPPPPGKPKIKVGVNAPKKVKAGKRFTIRVKTTNSAQSQSTRATRAVASTTATTVKTCVTLPRGVFVVNPRGGKVSGRKVCWTRRSLAAGRSVNYSVVVRSSSTASGLERILASARATNSAGATANASANSRVRVIKPKPKPKPKPPTG